MIRPSFRFTILIFALILSLWSAAQSSRMSLNFSGNNSVNISNAVDNLTLPVSMSMWVKIQASPSDPVLGIFKSNNPSTSIYTGFWLYASRSAIVIAYGDGGGVSSGNRRNKLAYVNFSNNDWVHITGVIRGANDMDIYINGVDVGGTHNGSGGALFNAVSNGSLGRAYTGQGWARYFKGNIDELSVWSKALSANEVRKIMCQGVDTSSASLATYYKFDTGIGNSLVNSKMSAANGVLQSSPSWQTSGAAIGDSSYYTYAGGGTVSQFTTTLSTGLQIEVKNINPPVKGVQVYEVLNAPTNRQGIPATINPTEYFGVYLARTNMNTQHTFDLELVNAGNSTTVYGREDNAQTPWQSKPVTYPSGNTLVTGVTNRHEFVVNLAASPLNCFVDEEYNSPTLWQNDNSGSQLQILNGKAVFQNATSGANRRIYKALDTIVSEDSCWTAKFDLNLIQGGVGNAAGHTVLALTNGNDCPYNNCTDVNTSFSLSSEKGVLVQVTTPRNGGQPQVFGVGKNNATVQSSLSVSLLWGNQYYLTLEKTGTLQAELSVFSNSARTQQVGSTVTFSLPPNIGDLNYIQHSVMPQGHPDRKLTADVDNFCLDLNSPCCDFSFSLANDTVICKGDPLTIGKPSVAGEQYLWNTGATTSTITVVDSGTYRLEVDSNGCVFTDEIRVDFHPSLPFQIIGNTLFCDSTVLSIQGMGYTNLVWSTSETSAQISVTNSGQFWASAEDASTGCTVSDTINVQERDLSLIARAFPKDTLICQRSSVTLDASALGAMGYVWNDGTTSTTFQVFSSGQYWVTANFGNGCERVDSIFIQFSKVPDPMLQASYTLCKDSVVVSLNNPSAYTNISWSNGGNGGSQKFTSAGIYSVTLTNSQGCQLTQQFTVVQAIIEDLAISIGDTTVCNGDSIHFNQPPNLVYSWSDGTKGSRGIYASGSYNLVITDSCGVANIYFTVDNIDCDCQLYIPNAFTPNNDNLNDQFFISSRCLFSYYEFVVFDRWGKRVFKSNDINEGWDGVHQGRDLPTGEYRFVVRYINEVNFREEKEMGSITIIR